MIQEDKLLHLLLGFLIGLRSPAVVPFVAFGKEALDAITGCGTPEVLDVFFTLLGGFIALLVKFAITSVYHLCISVKCS